MSAIDWTKRGQEDAAAKRPASPPWPPLNGSAAAEERHARSFHAYMAGYAIAKAQAGAPEGAKS